MPRKLADPGDNGYYPIADSEVLHHGMESRAHVRAKPTGEYRVPRKGEWFLSGASVEAYQALSDFMSSEYHIAKLVKGKLVWVPDQDS
jgi:hypothetical protein